MSSNSSTAAMKVDILKEPKSTNLLRLCPQLKEISEFVTYLKPPKKAYRDNVIRYIVLLYSEDSPINKRHGLELKDKRRMAATMAGFDVNEHEYHANRFVFLQGTKKVNDKRIEEVLALALAYLKWQKSYKFTQLAVCYSLIEEYTEQLMTPIKVTEDDKKQIEAITKKKLIREEMNATIKQVEKLQSEVYREHEEVKLFADRQGSIESRAHAPTH